MGKSRPHNRFKPISVAAASLLPPPRPAATGMLFSRRMFAPLPPPVDSSSSVAARRARFSDGSIDASEHSIASPSAGSRLIVSNRSTVCIIETMSWYPSSRRPSTSSVRLTFAGALSVSMSFWPASLRNSGPGALCTAGPIPGERASPPACEGRYPPAAAGPRPPPKRSRAHASGCCEAVCAVR